MSIMRSSNASSSAAEMAPLIPHEPVHGHLVTEDGAQLALDHKPELRRNHTTLYRLALEFIKAPWTDKLQVNVRACICNTQFLDGAFSFSIHRATLGRTISSIMGSDSRGRLQLVPCGQSSGVSIRISYVSLFIASFAYLSVTNTM